MGTRDFQTAPPGETILTSLKKKKKGYLPWSGYTSEELMTKRHKLQPLVLLVDRKESPQSHLEGDLG